MPTSAFFAVLRDAAKLAATAADDLASQTAKLALASDDVAALSAKAAAKTAGVVGDDLAVGAGQVGGMAASREIPAVLRIMRGSAMNKTWLAAALLAISAYAPWLISALLVVGALYLAYEGGEGLLERFHPSEMNPEFEAELSEDDKVRGAIRTDLVLSLEILVIALAAAGDVGLGMKAAVLAVVSVAMTLLVYGTILLIIRLDDMGYALARARAGGAGQWLGERMVRAAPVILQALEPVGMVAMFAVAGSILSHQLHLEWAFGLLGIAVDIVIGAATGVVLALGVHWGLALRHSGRGPRG